MSQTVPVEIQRLKQLHRAAELELQPLTQRRHLSSDETTAMTDLKKKKLRLKDRITRLESIPPEPDIP